MPRPEDETRALSTTPAAPQDTEAVPAAGQAAGGAPATPVPGVAHSLAERYDALEEIGRGGMGLVYRARDRETGETVALKVLKPEIVGRSDHVERFRSELRLARRITHKHVCRTHELLRFGDVVAITMEYVPGESLRQVLRRFGGVPFRRGLAWARQICSALAEAHTQGVVHRDLKPENILIDPDGQAKIMDFGIARAIEAPETHAGELVGTPAYMSPEQAEGRPVDGRTDIYALGLILYEMFAGRAPFEAETPMALLHHQIHTPPRSPREVERYVPQFLERVILKCLEKDPARRFVSVAELDRALADETVTSSPAAAMEVPDRLLTTHPSDFVLVALGAGGLAAFFFLAPRLRPEIRFPVEVTRPQLFARADQEIRRRGWSPDASDRSLLELGQPPHLKGHYDADLGRVLARDPAARVYVPSAYGLEVHYPQTTGRAGSVGFESDGRLQLVDLPVDWVPPAAAPQDRERALAIARADLSATFGIDVSGLKLENEAPLNIEGRRGWTFSWRAPPTAGLRTEVAADVYDRVTRVKRGMVPAQPSVGEENNILTILVLCVVWVAVSVAILAAGRLYRTMTARSLAVFAVCGFGMALNILSMSPSDADSRASGFLLSLLLWTMLGLMLSVGGAITSTAALHVLGRRSPGLTASTAALLAWKPARRATAMALVRGAAWGLLALGLREALAVLIMPLGLEWAEAPDASTVFSPIAGLVTLSGALFSAFVTVALMALVMGFIRRRTESWAWCGVAGAVVAAVMHFGRWDSATVALVAVGAILAAAIVWHDLLTGLVAALTFWMWSDAYPILRILERVGNGGVVALFVLWAVAIAWGAGVGLPELWAAARRQVSDLG
jgi:serine/threonine protein kinase